MESDWTVKQQIIEDPVSGITIQFEVLPGGEPRLRLFANQLPTGNREIQFDRNGDEAGTGTFTRASRPTWMVEVGNPKSETRNPKPI